MGKIFLSHSSANNAEALAVQDWLSENGWNDIFLDLDPERGLIAGDRWQVALKNAAERCELIVFLITPDWARSKWCLAEFLLAKQMNKQILGVIVRPTPIPDLPLELTAEWQLVDLTIGAPGWTATIAPPRLAAETTVVFSEPGLVRLKVGLQKAGLDAGHFAWPPAADPKRAPYRGLLPLDADDAGIFFGRDGAIVLSLDGLRGKREAAPPRFTTILGASGAGKSSFLRAGILPRLVRDSRNFLPLPVIRPERAPLTGEHGLGACLHQALAGAGLVRNRADVRAAVAAGADAVVPLLKQLAASRGENKDVDGVTGVHPTLVFAVDQAEELLAADASQESTQFLSLLADLARRDDPAAMVILTVRSDSFDRLQSRPELAETQPHHLIDLPPIPVGAFGDVIRGPVARMNAGGRKLSLEEPLVDALLADMQKGGAKDALPLLAFTLERLYLDYGADGDLKLSEYEALGRIRGAIEAAVEEALNKANGNPEIPQDRTARLALLRRGLIPWLAGIDPETGTPRRRVAKLSEIPAEARPLMQLMVEQRLLATDIDRQTDEVTIEPAHEALLRQWGALDGWLVEDSADLAVIEAVRRAASDWTANAKDVEFIVHKGVRLGAAESAFGQEKFAGYFTAGDRAYLTAAHDLEERAQKAARAAKLRRNVAAGVAGATVIVGATVGFFLWSASEASRVQAAAFYEIARSEAALREGNGERAAVSALAALKTLETTATRTAAATAMMGLSPNTIATFDTKSRVVDIAWQGADQLAVLSAGGTLSVLDARSRKVAATEAIVGEDSPPPFFLFPRGEAGLGLMFSDTSLATLAKGSAATSLAEAPADEFIARFGASDASADGTVLVSLSVIGEVLVRECNATPCVDRLLPETGVVAVAVRPDGDKVAVARSDGEIAIYSVAGTEPEQVLVAEGRAAAIDWAHDADLLAVGNGTGQIQVLDAAGGATIATIETGVAVTALEWSPVAPLLAAPCDATDICVYRVTADRSVDAVPEAQLIGHGAAISAIRWNATGDTLASTALDEPVRLWAMQQNRDVRFDLIADPAVPLSTLAVDRERGVTAAGDTSGAIWIWSADDADVQRMAPPAGVDAEVTSLAFQSDGRLAAVHQNQAVAIWTIGATAPDRLLLLDNVSFSRVAAIAGSAMAAVPLSDKRVIVFNGADLEVSELGAGGIALDQWGITAGSGENLGLISYSDGTIRQRDLVAGGDGTIVVDGGKAVCGVPIPDANGAKSLEVSPDGKWLVATRTDWRVVVHSLSDPSRTICMKLAAPDTKVVAFSPDSTRLAILSSSDQLYVFDLTQPDGAIILGAPAVPERSVAGRAAGGNVRAASWLVWLDNETLGISTIAGTVEAVTLDAAKWRQRMDSVILTE